MVGFATESLQFMGTAEVDDDCCKKPDPVEMEHQMKSPKTPAGAGSRYAKKAWTRSTRCSASVAPQGTVKEQQECHKFSIGGAGPTTSV